MIKSILELLRRKIGGTIKDIIYGKTIDETKIIFEVCSEDKGAEFIMIDVGAHFGGSLLPFAKNEWTIYACEPDPSNREKLVSNIATFKNVKIDTRAISNESNQEVSFYTSDVSTGISSLAGFHNSHKATTRVKTTTLYDFCLENGIEKIDFLKIDTEGFDLLVLKGFNWEKQEHPKYIVTEFEDRKTKPLGYNFHDQVKFLKEKGYQVLLSEWYPIVEYGKRHKWRRFVEDAHLVTDESAWGNLIATKPENYHVLLEKVKNMVKL